MHVNAFDLVLDALTYSRVIYLVRLQWQNWQISKLLLFSYSWQYDSIFFDEDITWNLF